MSLPGEQQEVTLADGSVMRSEVFWPDGEGSFPGVLVLHESYGLNDDIRRIARRLPRPVTLPCARTSIRTALGSSV